MTEDEHTGSSPEEVLTTPFDDDLLLKSLIALVAEHDVEVGITLHTTGGVVTGILTNGKKWNRAIAEQNPDLTGLMDGIAEAQAEVESNGKPIDYVYIHLRDAQVALGSELVPTGGKTLWRGRLSQVAGWSFGVLGRNN